MSWLFSLYSARLWSMETTNDTQTPMTATRYQKQHLTLPQEAKDLLLSLADNIPLRNSYLYLLRKYGWTLESLGQALQVTKERVRQYTLSKKVNPAMAIHLPEFRPPVLVLGKPKHIPIEPTPETLARLLELQPLVQQVRANSPMYREEAEEYTWLLNYSHTIEKVTLYRLAKRLGVTHGALRFRLARYGYLTHTGKSSTYTAILDKNRVKFTP